MKQQFFRGLKLVNIGRSIRQISKISGIPRLHGIDVLRDPSTNKGTAFSLRERQLLGIHGLLPPSVLSMDQQVEKMMFNLQQMSDDLLRYSFLTSLQDRNERLFYKLIMQHIEYCMPIIYTPTVGYACQLYGSVFRRPRGLYITIHDQNHITSILRNWPESDVKAIVVTDGERILGLGDLGTYGIAIPIGKLSLYTALAGVHPKHCLPIILDVGTNNQELLIDPFYTGIRHKRIGGKRYDEFVEHFMQAVVNMYGSDCLIQFEDFGNENAFSLLQRYQSRYCTFNDDIQGTAAVTVAGLLAASRITERKLSGETFLFVGAGEAATGIATLLVKTLQSGGMGKREAYLRIYMTDKDGLLVVDRPGGGLTEENKVFARNDLDSTNDLEEIVRTLKPTVLIGASGQNGIFTPVILKQMAQNVKRPIIFALSNPTSKSECTAVEAYTHTEGRCVFASGSPFQPVELDVAGVRTKFVPGQCNNSYIFPGVGLAITTCRIRPVTSSLFVRAAQCLADQVTEDDLQVGRIYPPLQKTRDVSLEIAAEVATCAYQHDVSHLFPRPEDLRLYLKRKMYHPDYFEFLPETYEWPPEAYDG